MMREEQHDDIESVTFCYPVVVADATIAIRVL